MKNCTYIPTFRFKGGKLCIFGQEEVTVITGWPDLKAVTKKASAKRWNAYWPYFRLILPYRRPARASNTNSTQQLPEEIKHCVFPRPPLPGENNCVVPLRSAADLIEEGRVQSNCVASYAKQVEHGGIFIYRVIFPERATVSIVRN